MRALNPKNQNTRRLARKLDYERGVGVVQEAVVAHHNRQRTKYKQKFKHPAQ